MATVAENLLAIADMVGMDPRARMELLDKQAELDEILDGDWIEEG